MSTIPPQNASELLRTQGLCAWYGAAQVLFGVGLCLQRGEVVALLGRNGAGKSSTLKAIMGLMPRASGQVQCLGQAASGLATHRIAQQGVAYVPEDRRIFTDLTVLENLGVGRQSPRCWPSGEAAPEWTVERVFALFPNLAAAQHRRASHMSGGEQKMLSVARGLMGNPLLLLLDEPSEGVAPLIVEQMAATILALKRQGIGILLCEQNSHFAALVADRAYVLEQGAIRYEGAMASLMADDTLRGQYLGL